MLMIRKSRDYVYVLNIIKCFIVKPYDNYNKGNIWAMYKENDKNLTSVENSSSICQTFTPTFV